MTTTIAVKDGWAARWYDEEEEGGRFVAVREAGGEWVESEVEAATSEEALEVAQSLIAEIEDA